MKFVATRSMVFGVVAAVFACTQQAPEEPLGDAPAEPEKLEEAAPDEPEPEVDEPAEPAKLPRTPSLEGAKVFIKSPADGDEVTSPVKIEFGVEVMKIVKAGDDTPGTGHHHLIVDAELPPMDLPIPSDENYIHFGDASTSTEKELSPGEHKLQLLLGDHLHIPHDPPVYSEPITITVK
ncbi:MAG: DUF4399 domain-containing protein [Myxococcota bacterium]